MELQIEFVQNEQWKCTSLESWCFYIEHLQIYSPFYLKICD